MFSCNFAGTVRRGTLTIGRGAESVDKCKNCLLISGVNVNLRRIGRVTETLVPSPTVRDLPAGRIDLKWRSGHRIRDVYQEREKIRTT